MELSDWLVFLHILGAILWMGGAIVHATALAMANRDRDRGLVVRRAHDLDWVGTWLIGPSAVVVILVGIWLTVIEDWVSFSQLWIWLSLVLVGVSMVLGIGYFGPEGRRIGVAAAERGSDDPDLRRRVERLLVVSWMDIAILLVVLWLMVFKPGV